MTYAPDTHPLDATHTSSGELPCTWIPIMFRSVPPQFTGITLHTSGFTLIELVIVIMIVGILSVVAMPRFFDQNAFKNKGFYDQTQSALRDAQKEAIAQRRTVCATFTATSLTLTIASVPDTANCNSNLASPTGGSPFVITATGNLPYAITPTNFNFNALGQPSTPQTITITGVGNIIIEPETGYVHS